MPEAEPTSEIARCSTARHVLGCGRSEDALSDDTGVLPMKKDAITAARIVDARMDSAWMELFAGEVPSNR